MTTSHHYHQYAYDMINLAIYAQKMYNVISSNSLSLYRTLFFESFSSVYSLTRLPYYKIIWNKWYSIRLLFKTILSLMNRLQHDYFWHKVLFRHLFYWNQRQRKLRAVRWRNISDINNKYIHYGSRPNALFNKLCSMTCFWNIENPKMSWLYNKYHDETII